MRRGIFSNICAIAALSCSAGLQPSDLAGGPAGSSDAGDAGTSPGADAASPDGDASMTTVPKDSGPSADAPAPSKLPPAPPPPVGQGWITFRMKDGNWHRVEAKVGAAEENLATGLDKISAGSDAYVTPSPDGQWLVAQSGRFDCGSGNCLSRFYWDLSAGEPILSLGKPIRAAEARPLIASGGDTIVFTASGPHAMDLFATSRQADDTWSVPLLMTGASPFSHHHDAAISADGTKVVCDCGAEPYGAAPTSLCEVGVDGSGFRKAWDPSLSLGGSRAAHHPDYAPDGSIVFEESDPETVWRLPVGASQPVRLSPANETNDNSPCVLADGRIASLWLERIGNPNGDHELKVMSASGTSSQMVLTGLDIVDIGMSCGR